MSLTEGDRLGKYEIVASLGSGGMGEVHHALDPRLEREVAIKIIKPATSTSDAHARLWREARAAASISHRTSARSTTSGRPATRSSW